MANRNVKDEDVGRDFFRVYILRLITARASDGGRVQFGMVHGMNSVSDKSYNSFQILASSRTAFLAF